MSEKLDERDDFILEKITERASDGRPIRIWYVIRGPHGEIERFSSLEEAKRRFVALTCDEPKREGPSPGNW